MSDDWVTCVAIRGERVLAGTYTGGLLERRGGRFVRALDPQRFAVRGVAFLPGSGRAVAATPLGVYAETASGWAPLPARLCGGLEAQAVLPAASGVWVGSRTGLAYVPLSARRGLSASR